ATRATDEIATTVDILPSLAKLIGARLPDDRKIDGKNVLDVLLGKPGAKSPHEILYYEDGGIRRGKWKLVRAGRGKTELYDLDADLGERRNLARRHPELVEELNALLAKHAADIRRVARPPGMVQNPKPIISRPGDLPRLRALMGLADFQVPGSAPPKKPRPKEQAVAPGSARDATIAATDVTD
ncbi:MAG: hypothetical protein OER86_07860, partial [Phycisphaerae bacterium]|nr:hypothetical protein [Phycisphaerae bacterium]